MSKRNAPYTPIRTTRRRLSFDSSGPFSYSYGKHRITTPNFKVSYGTQTDDGFQSLPATSVTGGASAKTAGFIATTLAASRPQKDIFNVKGLTVVKEIGGVVAGGVATPTSGNVVAVGHACCPSWTAHQMMWRAIVKHLFVRAGLTEMSDFNTVIPGVSTGDLVRVVYRADADSSMTQSDFTLTSGVTTFEAVADAFRGFFTSNYNADLSFHAIQLIPLITGATWLNSTYISLKRCMVYLKGKSSLKIQNTTSEVSTGDEESLNNVPLHGKAYYGKGTGTEGITNDSAAITSGVTFRADNEYGAIAKVPTERWYQEIPPPSQFTQVSTFGKIVLDPGHIKTSVVSFYKAIPLNSIYRSLFDNDINEKHTKTRAGVYRFVLLEKMIASTTPTADNQIKIQYEVNLRMGCYVTTQNSTETAQLNDVQNIAGAI